MKKFLCFLIIVSILLSCTSCALLNTGLIQDEGNAWYTCAAYAVPFMFNKDLRSNVEREVERDEYGRVLFTYYAYSALTDDYKEVAVICQNHDANYVYFYEDICYTYPDYSDEDLENLKTANDWNHPLNEKKMSRRLYKTTLDGVINVNKILEYSKVREACINYVPIKNAMLSECVFDDINHQSQHEMYYVQVADENSQIYKYLAIINKEYNVYLLPMETDFVSNTEIANFKTKSGWKYGY